MYIDKTNFYQIDSIIENGKNVKMYRDNDIAICDEKAAIEYVEEYGSCLVAIIPTIDRFECVYMSKRSTPYGVIQNCYNIGDSYKVIIFDNNVGAISKPDSNVFSNFTEAINHIKNKLQRIGDYCVTKYKGEKDRMYLAPTIYSSIVTKDGWWDTFTLMSGKHIDTTPNHRYLSKITGFRIDSNGYRIMMVEPVFELDHDEMIDGYIYYHTRYLVGDPDYYKFGEFISSKFSKWNFTEAQKNVPFKTFISDPYNQEMQEKIKESLKVPTERELDILSLKKAAEENPKVSRKIELCGGLEEYALIVEESYWNLKIQGFVPDVKRLGEKAILVIDYYNKKKAEEKAAKKAAKAAKKNK